MYRRSFITSALAAPAAVAAIALAPTNAKALGLPVLSPPSRVTPFPFTLWQSMMITPSGVTAQQIEWLRIQTARYPVSGRTAEEVVFNSAWQAAYLCAAKELPNEASVEQIGVRVKQIMDGVFR